MSRALCCQPAFTCCVSVEISPHTPLFFATSVSSSLSVQASPVEPKAIMNILQVVLPGFSKRLSCFVQAKTLCRYGCMYFLAALVLVCVDVIVMSYA